MSWKIERQQIIDQINNRESIYSDNTYNYKLTHYYDHEPRVFYVKANIEPETMDVLIAYIQSQMSAIEMEYSMDQTEVISILKQFYNAQDSKRSKSVHIDLYYNWEKWCGVMGEIDTIELFHREGLMEKLRELYNQNKNKSC